MGLEAEVSPSVVPSTTSGAAPVANEVKEEDKTVSVFRRIWNWLTGKGPQCSNLESKVEHKFDKQSESTGENKGTPPTAGHKESKHDYSGMGHVPGGGGGANNNAEDSKFVGSFAFVNASHSPNGGAWEHTKKWDDAAIKGFGEFIEDMGNMVYELRKYKVSKITDTRITDFETLKLQRLRYSNHLSISKHHYINTPLQCSQSVVLLLLIYSRANGLPVCLKRINSSGRIVVYDSKLHSAAHMLEAARVFSPKDLRNSSFGNTISMDTGTELKNGLLCLSTGHAAIYCYSDVVGGYLFLQGSGTIKSTGATFTLPSLNRPPETHRDYIFQFNFKKW